MRSLPLRRLAIAAAMSGVLAAALSSGAAADTSDYAAAIAQARQYVSRAQAGDPSAGNQAASVLRVRVGGTQPEIVADLEARPPQLDDAARRLDLLQAALSRPVATPDRGRADRELKSILAEPRYQPGGPNLLQIIENWLVEQFTKLFRGGGSTGRLLAWLELAFAAVIGAAVVLFIARALWSRRGGAPVTATDVAMARRAAHSFAEADRLAAAGDFPAALRALTSAVATTVGGIGTWEASPFTVRELFAEKRILEGLRPLVLPFEEAAYGHRTPDAATYDRAASVAKPYRAPRP